MKNKDSKTFTIPHFHILQNEVLKYIVTKQFKTFTDGVHIDPLNKNNELEADEGDKKLQK